MVELVGGCLVGSNCLDAQKVLGVWTGVFGTCLYFFFDDDDVLLACLFPRTGLVHAFTVLCHVVGAARLVILHTHRYVFNELKFN